MRFTVSKSTLAKALTIVSKGMGTNSTLPILSGIYMKAADGTLELQTTNLTVSVRNKVAANVEEPGETVISGRLLTNIVKNLPEAAVTVEGGPHTLEISCESSNFHLNALEPTDFPEFPTFALERSIELPSDILQTMVSKVYKVTSTDTSRPILAGILMRVEQNTVRLVATDSYRLAVCDTNVETPNLEDSFEMIVPGTTFHDVLSLPSDEPTILIGTTESQVVFVFGNTTYISRKVEGNYPNYKQLLPSACTSSVKFNVNDFSAALKRVSVVAVSNPSVKFELDGEAGVIRMSSVSSDQGEARESVAAEITGEDMPIALNYHYVFDCVNASDDAEMTLELQSSMQPGVFKSYSKINYLYLLMPVRM